MKLLQHNVTDAQKRQKILYSNTLGEDTIYRIPKR